MMRKKRVSFRFYQDTLDKLDSIVEKEKPYGNRTNVLEILVMNYRGFLEPKSNAPNRRGSTP